MKILAFAGSLRKGSINKALLRAVQEHAPEGMEIGIFDIGGIPLFNQDLEAFDLSPEVIRFREAITGADGILIASPEYNHGITGVTKNVLDWASRPPGKSAISGKPVGVIGASPGATGTARSQDQLRQSLKAMNTFCMPQPELLVFRAGDKFDADGNLTDEATIKFLARFLSAFEAWVKKFV